MLLLLLPLDLLEWEMVLDWSRKKSGELADRVLGLKAAVVVVDERSIGGSRADEVTPLPMSIHEYSPEAWRCCCWWWLKRMKHY